MIPEMPSSEVRTRFDIPRNSSFVPLGSAGGFSGATFWQVETIEETYCLRRWPKEHPTAERLDWIHRVLVHCAANGASQVDAPLKTVDRSTWLKSEGYLWQLSQWMPGKADFWDDPSDARLVNAIQCLARFHLAAAQVNLDFRPSANVAARLKTLADVGQQLHRINESPVNAPACLNDLRIIISPLAVATSQKMLAGLSPFESTILPIQPVIRDVWHDHLLFIGDEVTGLVDFGAMEMDTVCLDISRLLGSLVGNDDPKWQIALASYAGIRALTEPERQLIKLLDQSMVLLGCMNWLKWFYIDQREFEDMNSVEKRIAQLQLRWDGIF